MRRRTFLKAFLFAPIAVGLAKITRVVPALKPFADGFVLRVDGVRGTVRFADWRWTRTWNTADFTEEKKA